MHVPFNPLIHILPNEQYSYPTLDFVSLIGVMRRITTRYLHLFISLQKVYHVDCLSTCTLHLEVLSWIIMLFMCCKLHPPSELKKNPIWQCDGSPCNNPHPLHQNSYYYCNGCYYRCTNKGQLQLALSDDRLFEEIRIIQDVFYVISCVTQICV